MQDTSDSESNDSCRLRLKRIISVDISHETLIKARGVAQSIKTPDAMKIFNYEIVPENIIVHKSLKNLSGTQAANFTNVIRRIGSKKRYAGYLNKEDQHLLFTVMRIVMESDLSNDDAFGVVCDPSDQDLEGIMEKQLCWSLWKEVHHLIEPTCDPYGFLRNYARLVGVNYLINQLEKIKIPGGEKRITLLKTHIRDIGSGKFVGSEIQKSIKKEILNLRKKMHSQPEEIYGHKEVRTKLLSAYVNSRRVYEQWENVMTNLNSSNNEQDQGDLND